MCKRVHYWGTVQGVGFRMMTRRIASQFAVTGSVRNLPDGQVEVIVVGDSSEIERFLGEVASRMAHAIEGHRIDDAPDPTPNFTNFDIRK